MRDTRLCADSPQTFPPNSKRRNTKLECSTVIDATGVDNIILHNRSEARALQSSTPNSLQKHLVEVNRIGIGIDSLLEESDKIEGSPVEEPSVFNCDVINHVPRILLIVTKVLHENMEA